MAQNRIEIRVRFKEGILDPQAEAIASALSRLKFHQVKNLSVEKSFVVTVEAKSEGEALELGHKMARDLLANIVMEDFDVRSLEADQ